MNEIESSLTRASGNFSIKVVAIAAGEAHTLALTADGNVYSWGRGTFGRLGTGSEEDQHVPVRVNFNSAVGKRDEAEKLKFVGVAAGAYHSLAFADDGSIWSWGYNVYGQLGVNGDNSSVPRLLEGFLDLGNHDPSADDFARMKRSSLMITSVKAGGMMSLAIDSHGALWMWGNCPLLQGNQSDNLEFSLVSSCNPIPVWNFHGRTVVKVACGNEHVVALVSAGETYEDNELLCYSWGGNSHGQLGLGDKESRLLPEVVRPFTSESPWIVYEMACGAFHTALLSRRKSPTNAMESVCWTFGLGDNGQLGHGTTQSYLSPQPVRGLPQHVFLVSVDCGLFHTSVVSSAGDLWSWGMEKGLGLCPDASFIGADAGDAVLPLLISCNELYGPRFPEPVQVACGAAHTVLLADSGYKLWSWGRGRSGVLGNGDTFDCFTPIIVSWPPLLEDFRNEKNAVTEQRGEKNKPEEVIEIERKLSMADEEVKLLRSKLSLMERYASILHGSIFGRPLDVQEIPVSLQNGGAFDIAKEWENMLESSDRSKLRRLEMFYRNMLAGVKDKLMKNRIQEIVKDFLNASTAKE